MANVTIQGTPLLRFEQFGVGIAAGASIPVSVALRSILQSSGTAADQCDLLHARKYTFVSSTPQTIDLTAMTDLLGNTISMARVKYVIVKVYATTDGQALTLGAAGSNEWSGAGTPLSASGTLTVAASTANNDGYFLLGAPNTTGYLVDSTHKLLKLNPGAAAFAADVVIGGCSA
jgi:hypothetical protein